MDGLVPPIIVQSFGLGPDFVEVSYMEASENEGDVQHGHTLSAQFTDLDNEIADVQEALCVLVDKILLNNRKPPATIRPRR